MIPKRWALCGGLLVWLATSGALSARESAAETGPVCLTSDCTLPVMPWTGPKLNAYVHRLSARLARQAGSEKALRIRVVYWPQVFCEALPSGLVVLSTGAVIQSKDEAELSVLLGREILRLHSRRSSRSWRSARGEGIPAAAAPAGTHDQLAPEGRHAPDYESARLEVLRYEKVRAQALGEGSPGRTLLPLGQSRRQVPATPLAQAR